MRARTPAATARAIGEPLPPLRELRPGLPPDVCEPIDACLDPDPDERPSVEELEASSRLAIPQLDGAPGGAGRCAAHV